MSNYVKATNFATKDTLPTGDANKIVKGTELDNEFNSISGAISSKADLSSPALTGTPTAPTATSGANTTQVATTAFVTNAVTTATGSLGTMSTQNKGAVDIEGGTIDATVIGGTTPAAITGTTVTASTGFVGNVTGNVTGNAGTVTNGVYTSSFTGSNQSVTTNGYQKLPGGLILQWGRITGFGYDSVTSVSFPIAFPNAVFSVQATVDGSTTVTNLGDIGAVKTNSIGTSSFNIVYADDYGATSIQWFAVGY